MIKFTVNAAKMGKNIHMMVHELSKISNGGYSYVISSMYISVDVNESDVKLQR